MPLFLCLVEYGNGESLIAAMCLVVNESENLVRKMVEIFKDNNRAWEKICTIITDKDLVEWTVLGSEFPNAKLMLCLFHVLKAFKAGVTCEKMNINSNQRLVVLEFLQKMAYAHTRTDYMKLRSALQAMGLQKVT